MGKIVTCPTKKQKFERRKLKMIIVSQNKNIILNFNSIVHLFINKEDKPTVRYGRMLGSSEELGKYETEERAEEVLQEISIAYGNIEMLKIPNLQIHEFIPSEKLIQCLVYQMPEE